MLVSLGILIVAVVIAMIEVPSLVRKKARKDLWVFGFLLLLGTGSGIALSLQFEIPNPLDWIAYVMKPFSDFLFGLWE